MPTTAIQTTSHTSRSQTIHDRGQMLNAIIAECASRYSTIPSVFIQALFGRTAMEDLANYTPEALTEIIASSYQLLQQRTVGQAKINITHPTLKAVEGQRPQHVTVIEIINDNMPFLLDSVMAELQEQGVELQLVAHPIITVSRDQSGKLTGFYGEGTTDLSAGKIRESYIHIHVERIENTEKQQALQAGLEQMLADVRIAVLDWRPMLNRINEAIKSYKDTPPPVAVDELAEANQFLQWLADNNFTFLGMTEFSFSPEKQDDSVKVVEGSGLGILRDPNVKVLRRGKEMVTVTPEIREFLMQPHPLIITKANVKSRVHRRVQMDYIGIKLFDNSGKLKGELRCVGLFTSTAYTRSTNNIPFLRRKVDLVISRAGFDPDSHSGKALLNILEHYPRDELFQIDQERLYHFSMALLALEERPRLRVLVRPDKFDRFVSVLVYVPRDNYNTDVRVAIGNYLAKVYKGRVSAAYPTQLDGALARVHFIIGRYEGETPNLPQSELEADILKIVRTWDDTLKDTLYDNEEEATADALLSTYRGAFSAAYREAFPAHTAVRDMKTIDKLSTENNLAIDFYRAPDEETHVGLKLFHLGAPIPLSDRVPILENMGFRVIDERSYWIEPKGREAVSLHDIFLEPTALNDVDLRSRGHVLEEAYLAVWNGQAEDDGYNALVLKSGLTWREVAVIRALSRYLRQVRIPYSQDYMWNTVVKHAPIAQKIMALFHVRFDPGNNLGIEQREAQSKNILDELEALLEKVTSLDEDLILRRFINVILATQRTTYYQRTEKGQPHPVLAFKLESKKIDALPDPKPLYEISVYSPRVEGVHLRFGKVARGGLRWSDRPQDFRTEVLGLVKAQQVKNAVIVPVGAKGGFVPKKLPPASQREAWLKEGTEAYKIFVSSLLDLTDNLDGEKVAPPQNTVRWDKDDPYLVVAADKGTATFSDTANGLSQNHGFWLDDAFASGGSQGYDHKKMGITARGAWEAVKRHFREMNINIQTTPFTVAGVGDMSGDVFGNGMLLSPAIKLVAAFDHRDIFIDPNPDLSKSFAERDRLFKLPRSSWQDYDKGLISKGGGVFSRAEKSIPLSPEMQSLLGLSGSTATPQQIMNAILKAPVDLMWFGGIGTYIRASSESDEDAGDRANDSIRITAAQLRAKVVGEGANLGMTQRARIECASKGCRINTDAIDNSAGVNSSDVEVNIKICLSRPVRDGRLKMEARNTLLASMTDDVANLVLRNNYLQSLALSVVQQRGMSDFPFQIRLMHDLESRSLLDRKVEFLPDDAELDKRMREGRSLTRPELAVLLAYAKLTLYDALLKTSVPDDPYLSTELKRYFPKALQDNFALDIEAHRLRREIIATGLCNAMINRGGPALIVRLKDQTGADEAGIARAFAAARDVFGLTNLNTEIDALDNMITGEIQNSLYLEVQNALLSAIPWFLRNGQFDQGLEKVIAHYQSAIAKITPQLINRLGEAARTRIEQRTKALIEAKVPQTLAQKITLLPYAVDLLDVVLVSDRSQANLETTASAFFAAGEAFALDDVLASARNLPLSDYYDRLALERTLDVFTEARRKVTTEALQKANGDFAKWLEVRGEQADRSQQALQRIAGSGLSLSKLMVAAATLNDVVN